MAGVGLLIALAGAVGTVLHYIVALPVMTRLPVPHTAWPIAAVCGFVVYTFTRRAAD